MSFSITVSPGPKNNPKGRRHPIDPTRPVASLEALLNAAPTGREAWWSSHTWEGDHRTQANWRAGAGVTVDLDYVNAAGEHSIVGAEDAARFKAAIASLQVNLWHPSPRGARVVFVFPDPCEDAEVWKKAAAGAAALCSRWLRVNRLDCDRGAHLAGYELDESFADLARFMYTPRALVSGIQRSAQVATILAAPVEVAALVKAAPEEKKTTPKATAAGPAAIRSARAFANFQEAAEQYNRDHARDWGRPGAGQCPACGHKDCFGRSKGAESRWACFSTNHVDGCGVRADAVVTGDALDLDAYLAHRSPADHLRANGYLEERGSSSSSSGPSWEEPPPLTDADAPPDLVDSPKRSSSHLSLVPPDGGADDPNAKPVVRISTDEERVNDAAIAALARDDRVFQRGRALVQVLRGINASRGLSRAPDALTIAEISLPRLRELLANAAIWEQVDAKATAAAEKAAAEAADATGTDGAEAGTAVQPPKPKKAPPKTRRTHPPEWSVKAVASRGRWEGIRPLTGVTEWPVLRVDGTILADPGYDPRTGLVYEPAGGVDPIPELPNGEEVEDALKLLRECVCDFPFADESAFSSWLAGLLTPLARYAFDGPAPCFLAEANTRGSGKTLLWELVATILSGRALASTPYAEEDDEMAKKITACALSGDPLIFLDNIRDKFGGAALDQALTGRTWRDRILGKSQNTAELPLTAVWYATGNNLLFVGDIERRLCVCRLESPFENPETRQDFKHPDLLVWAKQERRRILSAGLLLLRAFAAAGYPRGTWTLWGSYEGWSRTVKACVEWLRLPEPPAPRSSGTLTTELEELVVTLEALEKLDPSGIGITASQLVHEIDAERERARKADKEPDENIQALVDSLGEALVSNSRKLGNRLRRWKGRVVRGRSLQVVLDAEGKPKEDRLGGLLWTVKRSAGDWAEAVAPGALAEAVAAMSAENEEKTDARFPD